MTEPTEDLGGAPLLPLLLLGTGQVADRLAEPGPKGLAAVVAERTDGAVTVEIDRAEADVPPLHSSLSSFVEQAARHPVTVVAFDGDLPGDWPDDYTVAFEALGEGVRALKAAGTRIIAVAVSTVDPTRPAAEAKADERTAHELDLALLELSIGEGISILDTDRIVAEQAADDHVLGFLRYDDAVLDLLTATMADILADYGFFEPRPLMPQIGVNNR